MYESVHAREQSDRLRLVYFELFLHMGLGNCCYFECGDVLHKKVRLNVLIGGQVESGVCVIHADTSETLA